MNFKWGKEVIIVTFILESVQVDRIIINVSGKFNGCFCCSYSVTSPSRKALYMIQFISITQSPFEFPSKIPITL